MSTPASFVSGLIGGIESGQRIAGTHEAAQKAKRDEAMSLEIYRQAQEDRTRNIGIQDENRALLLAENDRVVARQNLQDEQSLAQVAQENAFKEKELRFRELSYEQQRRVSDAQVNNSYTQQQVAQLEMDELKQASAGKEAQRLGDQASEHFRQGNFEDGLAAYAQLNDLGFGTKDVIDGKYTAQEAEDVIQGIMSGEKDIESPEFKKLASKLLMPAFVASGRDPKKFEPAGIRESRPGFFAIELRNKETGKIVPATHNRSPNDDDPITEVSEESLMKGATEWLKGAREAEVARDAIEAQKQINSVKARFMSDRVDKGTSRSRSKAEIDEANRLPKNQEAFIEMQATEGEKGLAKFLISEEGYDEQLPTKMARIKAIAAGDNEAEENMSITDAIEYYRDESEADGIIAKRLLSLTNMGIDEAKAERLVNSARKNGWDSGKYADEVQKALGASKGKATLESLKQRKKAEDAKGEKPVKSGEQPWYIGQ